VPAIPRRFVRVWRSKISIKLSSTRETNASVRNSKKKRLSRIKMGWRMDDDIGLRAGCGAEGGGRGGGKSLGEKLSGLSILPNKGS